MMTLEEKIELIVDNALHAVDNEYRENLKVEIKEMLESWMEKNCDPLLEKLEQDLTSWLEELKQI